MVEREHNATLNLDSTVVLSGFVRLDRRRRGNRVILQIPREVAPPPLVSFIFSCVGEAPLREASQQPRDGQ